MKISTEKILVLICVILSLVAVQSLWARSCSITISGVIAGIDSTSNGVLITVNDNTNYPAAEEEGATVYVYGIPLPYLANRLGITLNEGDSIFVTAHLCPYSGQLSACSISINGGDLINLPGRAK